MIHQHDAWTLERLSEYHHEALRAEANEWRVLKALPSRPAEHGLRHSVGLAMIRAGTWVAGRAADDLVPVEGQLSSTG